jgi:hypothetical protein
LMGWYYPLRSLANCEDVLALEAGRATRRKRHLRELTLISLGQCSLQPSIATKCEIYITSIECVDVSVSPKRCRFCAFSATGAAHGCSRLGFWKPHDAVVVVS